MFLIPAITMRSIAAERTEGTWELLLTKPIRLSALLFGKYLGGLTVVVLALVPTLLYSYSIYQLAMPIGNVDGGAIIGSYLGLLLLGGTFTAVGVFASSLSKNPVVAFLVAVFLCFILFYAFDALSTIPLFVPYADSVSAIGVQSHYDAISRGVLDSRDLLYFLSVIGFFLWATYASLATPHSPRKNKLRGWAICVGLIGLANILGNSTFGRADFTAEKRFTISPISKQTVSQFAQRAHITVFLDGKLPAGFTRLRKATADLLSDLKAYSGGQLTFSFVDPMDGDAQQQQENMEVLAELGIQPTNLNVRTASGYSQQLIFPGALITYGDEEIAVNLLQNRSGASHEQALNNSVQNLEYAFVSALRKVMGEGKPLVGFTEGHGELDNLQLYDAIQSLSDGYQLGFVDLNSMPLDNLGQLDLLIIAKPTQPFTEADKYKINHFVMNGGSVLWAIDQLDAELDSMRTSGDQTVIARQLNLDDMLFTYGIRFNYNLIADMNCASIPITMGNMGGQAQIELAPWLFYPIFMPTTAHPILKNLDGIRSEFAGTIDTLDVPGIEKHLILHSSPFSRLLNVPATISLQMVEETPDPTAFKNESYPVAALLEGEFPSLFTNRSAPQGIEVTAPTPESGKPAKMLVIADGDVFKGQVSPTDGSPYPLGWDRYTEQQYGNKSFLLNAVDYLTDDAGIISLREKEVKLRLLNQVKINDEKIRWQLLNVGVPPLLLVLFGWAQQYVRRRKYGRVNVPVTNQS